MTASTAPAEPSVIHLAVGGMTCAGCAATVQRGLAALPGVSEANVNIATRRATVVVQDGSALDELEQSMRAAIVGLGYQVLTPDRSDAAAAVNLADEHAAHRAADAARSADLQRRFWVTAVIGAVVVVLSMVEATQFTGWDWVVGALASVGVFYGGWPFHRSTIASIRHGATTMDTLVTLGSSAAWGWSAVALVRGQGHLYFETATVIVALIVLGKWLEVRSSAGASDAVRALTSRHATTVTLADGTEVAWDQLQVGMRFVVRAGQTIATDGMVVEGQAAVDASVVTGESVPVVAQPGREVVGGSIAVEGALTVEATRVGAATMVAQIARMVDEALTGKARVQRLADRIAAVFVPGVMTAALVTLVVWLGVTADASRAVSAAVAVLIISCPCALGLATPLAILVGVGRGAQLGILIRGARVLEDTRNLSAIIFDKTGTLTTGQMSVVEAYTPGLDADDAARLLAATATVEKRSEHPIARAIAAHGWGDAPSKGFRSQPGRGAVATVQAAGQGGEDVEVTVGSRHLFDHIDTQLGEWAQQHEQAGHTVVFAGRATALGGGLLGGTGTVVTREPLRAEAAIAVADTVRPDAREAVARLQAEGMHVTLLTGDNQRVAAAVAAVVGIDDVVAEVLPGDKAAHVQRLRDGGARVAMVGDGVNDAPALALADIGIAVGVGTDVAREASDITVIGGDLAAVPHAIALARRTLATIRGNLVWAFAYNVLAIPLAAAGLLHPMIAAAAMGGSSLFVVGNSLRLRRYMPGR